ncbi:MAG: hypothetical protein CFE24_13735 [Flavobacterium sp. BFFFF2]|nr:MAG: hypothetical protein CFE24_13735 [Flavobacterium sp. BFFFF2]
MSYQSVVRNAANQILTNQSIGVKISIVEGSITGTAVYSETHTITTNANGLFSLETGGGTPLSGTFSAINWGNGSHYIKSEIDVTGGTNYALSGTMELLSVPYALYAERSGNSTTQNYTSDGTFIPAAISNPSPSPLQYLQAIKYCADLVESGFSDWRLPKQEELEEYIFAGGTIPTSGITTWLRVKFNPVIFSNSTVNNGLYISLDENYSSSSNIKPIFVSSSNSSQSNSLTCHCIR